jgi:hypothetical protein
MTHKNRSFFLTVALLAALILLSIIIAPLDAEDGDSPINFSSEQKGHGLKLVSFVELALRDRVIGGLAAYDDPTTIRRVDCLALYEY